MYSPLQQYAGVSLRYVQMGVRSLGHGGCVLPGVRSLGHEGCVLPGVRSLGHEGCVQPDAGCLDWPQLGAELEGCVQLHDWSCGQLGAGCRYAQPDAGCLDGVQLQYGGLRCDQMDGGGCRDHYCDCHFDGMLQYGHALGCNDSQGPYLVFRCDWSDQCSCYVHERR